MTRFVIDASAAVRLAGTDREVAAAHQLLAPTLPRSQVLSLLHEAVQRGEIPADVARERLVAQVRARRGASRRTSHPERQKALRKARTRRIGRAGRRHLRISSRAERGPGYIDAPLSGSTVRTPAETPSCRTRRDERTVRWGMRRRRAAIL